MFSLSKCFLKPAASYEYLRLKSCEWRKFRSKGRFSAHKVLQFLLLLICSLKWLNLCHHCFVFFKACFSYFFFDPLSRNTTLSWVRETWGTGTPACVSPFGFWFKYVNNVVLQILCNFKVSSTLDCCSSTVANATRAVGHWKGKKNISCCLLRLSKTSLEFSES